MPQNSLPDHSNFSLQPSAFSLSPSAAAIAARRRLILAAALPHLEAGASQKMTAAIIDCPESNLSRVLALGSGITALDKCRHALSLPLCDLVKDVREETPSDWQPLLDDPALAENLRALYLSTLHSSSESMTHGNHTGSMSLALRRWADHTAMPAWAAQKLRDGSKPIAILRFLRKITPELEQYVRGQRHSKLHTVTSQKDNTIRLPDGSRARRLSGFQVVFDDMSCNQPFYTDVVENGKVIDTILSRQGLYAMDAASWRWLGVELVSRPREAYRAEDILRFVRKLMNDFGKFDCLVFEQGVWHSRKIRGFAKNENGDPIPVEFTRPGMSDEERAVLTEGLSAIGVHVQYVHSPRDKPIEGAFKHLQDVLATFTMDFQHIGAHAGEFEGPAKQLRRVRAGSHHPADLKFAHIDHMADRIECAFAWINAKPKDALLGKTPDQQWTLDMQLRRLPELAHWENNVFMPETRERVIAGGAIHFNRELLGYPFSFRAAEWMAELGHGYKVFIKFDPCEPTLGAVILNRESPSNPRNRWRFAIGQFICNAAFELPAPTLNVETLPAGHVAVEDYYGVGTQNDIGDSELRRQKSYHHTAYRSLPRPGQPAVRATSVRDGRGNSAQIVQNAVSTQKPAIATDQSHTSHASHNSLSRNAISTRRDTPILTTDDDLVACDY